jgi:Tol biopolymer transport system component
MRRPPVVAVALAALVAALPAAAKSPYGSDYGATPSPDGKWLLYTRSYPHSRYSESSALFVIGTDGRRARLVVPAPHGCCASWTHDNLLILGEAGGVKLVRPDTGEVVRHLTVGGRWSPNGKLLAYDRGKTLYVAQADGSNPVAIVQAGPDESFGGVTWSPDSRRLAYTMGVAHGRALELVGADGTGRVRVMVAGAGFPVSWSPDSSRLVFGAQAGGRTYRPPHLYMVNADGSGRRLFVGGDAFVAEWSPLGDWILFDRTLHPKGRDIDQVALIRPDGTGTRVVRGPRGLAGGDWLPDGRIVAVATGRCTRTAVYVLDLDGHARRVTNPC